MLSADCPAKINLTLRVGPLRPDGFHPIESLVTHVGLYDRVSITPRTDSTWSLECDDSSIPRDESNLALRAVRLLAAEYPGARAGGVIKLEKKIPSGAGLGGGSSNAAAMLRLLNQYWRLNASREKLAQLGAQLGSDVPLFLGPSPCVVRGRGEQLEPANAGLSQFVVLILPDLHCATAAVYSTFDRLPPPPQRPPITELSNVRGADAWMSRLFNDLEPAAFDVESRLLLLFERLTRISGSRVRMTGSGAALFRLFDDRDVALQFAEQAQAEGVRAMAVEIISAPNDGRCD